MSGSQITMPRLSDSMEEGTLITWLKGDGETVAPGDAIAEIESDKAVSEYAAEVAGVLRHLVGAGSTVAVGTPIATVGGDDTPAAAPQETARATGAKAATDRPPSPSRADGIDPRGRSPPPSHGAWPPATASISPPSQAPARGDGSRARTSWTSSASRRPRLRLRRATATRPPPPRRTQVAEASPNGSSPGHSS